MFEGMTQKKFTVIAIDIGANPATVLPSSMSTNSLHNSLRELYTGNGGDTSEDVVLGFLGQQWRLGIGDKPRQAGELSTIWIHRPLSFVHSSS